jgi:hypothetical protein
MADSYGGTSLSDEEKKDIRRAQIAQGTEMGIDYAAKGAALGAAGGGVGAAIGAGAGFLVGSVYGHLSYDREAEKQKLKMEKQAEAASENAFRAEQAARDLASKGSQVNIRTLPSGPPMESVLASSMPVTAGGGMPMDPYRQTVRNKFGWS